jgi:hypothetical protein
VLWGTLMYCNAVKDMKKGDDALLMLTMANIKLMVSIGKATNTSVERMHRASDIALDLITAEALKVIEKMAQHGSKPV